MSNRVYELPGKFQPLDLRHTYIDVMCKSQKKIKTTPASKAKLVPSASIKPTTQPEATTNPTRRSSAAKPAPSPARMRARANAPAGSPARSAVRNGSTTAGTVAKGVVSDKSGKPKVTDKSVFSPVRDPLGNSVGAGDISGTFTK